MGPCCCLSLRTGGILIAVFDIVFWSLNLVVSGILLVGAHVHPVHPGSSRFSADGNRTSEITGTDRVELTEEEKALRILSIAKILIILNFILSIVRITTASLLIYGILKKKPWLVKSWFGVKILVLFLAFGLLIATFTTDQVQIPRTITYAISISASFYFLWVVFELMAEMKVNAISARLPKPNRSFVP